jgi:large repetitive protein
VKDSYAWDVGSILQACIDIGFAGMTFNYYVSTNSTCNDSLTWVTLNQGQTGYICASVVNKGTETFEVRAGDASTTLGTDFSSLDHGYTIRDVAGSSGSVISSFVAGTGSFPLGVNTFTGTARVYGTDIKFTSTGTLQVSKSIRVTVLDVTPPLAPTVSSAGWDMTGPFTTTDNTPTITGTGEANTLITIRNASGTVIGTGMTDGSGLFSITFPVTADGTRSYAMINTDASGNVSLSTPFTLTIDTTPPVAPTIASIGWDTTAPFLTSDPTPTFTWSGEANSLITLTDGSVTIIGTGMTDGSGNYTITWLLSFADGSYAVDATSTDALGNISTLTSTTFTVDTTAPVAPTIVSPLNNSLLSDTTPTLTGTGEPNTVFTITNASGTILWTGTVDGSGNWTFTPSSPLPEGSNTLSVTTRDTAGNTSPSTFVTLLIDSLPPATPTVTNVAGDTTPIYLTNDSTPTIVGTAEVNSTVEIKNASGTTIGIVTTDGSGNWTFTPSSSLAEGINNLAATSTDATGNVSWPLSLPIQVDTTAPTSPTIANPTNGLLTNDNTPTINGTGEPGSIFTITNASGTLIGTGIVDLSGNYSFTPTAPLPDGPNTINVTTTDAAGNTSASTSTTFTVDTGAPTPLTITNPINGSITGNNTPTINGTGEPGTIFTIMDASNVVLGTGTVDGAGNYSFTPTTVFPDGSNMYNVTLTDGAGNTTSVVSTTFTVDTTAPVTPTISSPANNSLLSDTTPTLTGTGEPNTVFTITNASGTILWTGTVDGSGNWTFTPTTSLPEGSNTLSVTTTDTAGNTSLSASVILLIDSLPPATPTVTNVAGDTTPTYLTNDSTPTITGTAEASSTVEIKDASGTTLGTVTADASGNWSFTPSSPLAEGINNLTATVTDATGNISGTLSLPIQIDTTTPTAPTIANPTNGLLTNDNTPTINGTAEPGSTIIITDGSGNTIGTTTVDGSWNYTFTPTTPLPDGSNTINITTTDPAGNTSTPTTATFTVDSTPPDTFLGTTSPLALSGAIITTKNITVGFSSESWATLQCSLDGLTYTGCTSPVSYTSLAEGIHILRIRAIDLVGNIDPIPLVITFTVNSIGSGGSASSSSSSVVVTNPTIPANPNAPIASTPTAKAPTDNTPKISLWVSPTSATLDVPHVTNDAPLSSQAWLMLAGTTKNNQSIFEVKNRVTDYICPKIVKVYNLDEILATDIPSAVFTDDVSSVLMFRGLEKDEETTGIQTIKTYRNDGVAINKSTFEPSRLVTRAEYVKMLVRSLSCRYAFLGTDSGFNDVNKDAWYAEYITFGVKNGWMGGYSDGGFHPDAPITRAEAAKILSNAIKLEKNPNGVSSFVDVPNNSVFNPYIEALKDNKIISGTTANTYDPDRNIPRTEVSRIIYKTFLGWQR